MFYDYVSPPALALISPPASLTLYTPSLAVYTERWSNKEETHFFTVSSIAFHCIHSFNPFRRWAVNGEITQEEMNGRYYVDSETHKETSICLDAVANGKYLLLAGTRASGKSTRLHRLRQMLHEMGYLALE